LIISLGNEQNRLDKEQYSFFWLPMMLVFLLALGLFCIEFLFNISLHTPLPPLPSLKYSLEFSSYLITIELNNMTVND